MIRLGELNGSSFFEHGGASGGCKAEGYHLVCLRKNRTVVRAKSPVLIRRVRFTAIILPYR